MPGSSYERYGLTSNPFRELSSESLPDVEVFHVNLDVDRSLDAIKEEVYAKENRATIALVGLHGAGKTERLLLTQAEARDRKGFAVYFDVTVKTTWVVQGIASAIAKAANLGGFKAVFGAPRWFRDVAAQAKLKETRYDPVKAGRAIGAALNANAPSFLLLNDLHNLSKSSELGLFAKTLQEAIDVIKPGVLIMFGCYPNFMVELATQQPPLASRINRTLLLPRATDDEAALMVAKKLLAKRLVDGLDPLYPFDKEAIARLNQTAWGNPRRLLELADVAIEYAVAHRTYRIDSEVVRSALMERQVRDVKSMVESKAGEWDEDRARDVSPLAPGRGGERAVRATGADPPKEPSAPDAGKATTMPGRPSRPS